MERLLARLWSDVLELALEQIGVLDSFFDLGGDSLRATQVIVRLSQRIDKKVDVVTMFEYRTIRNLSRHLEGVYGPEVDQLVSVHERAAKQRAGLTRFRRND